MPQPDWIGPCRRGAREGQALARVPVGAVALHPHTDRASTAHSPHLTLQLLNLKGNLELVLSSRLSTSANIGELDLSTTRRALILGNLALLQVQALVVSLVAGALSFVLGLLSRGGDDPTVKHWLYYECVLVLVSGMIAASVSSSIVGSFMCALVVLSRRWGWNPDNFATCVRPDASRADGRDRSRHRSATCSPSSCSQSSPACCSTSSSPSSRPRSSSASSRSRLST